MSGSQTELGKQAAGSLDVVREAAVRTYQATVAAVRGAGRTSSGADR